MRAKGNGNPELCAHNLLRVARSEVPYERVKGLDPRLIDRPTVDVDAEMRQDAEWLIETYEPRVSVKAINIEATDSPSGGFIVTADVVEKEV